LKERLGVEVLARLVDQFEQNLALPSEAYTLLFERVLDAAVGHVALA